MVQETRSWMDWGGQEWITKRELIRGTNRNNQK